VETSARSTIDFDSPIEAHESLLAKNRDRWDEKVDPRSRITMFAGTLNRRAFFRKRSMQGWRTHAGFAGHEGASRRRDIRLAEVPGLGVDSAQQVIAEVGAHASTFPSVAELTSWMGTCPGKDESAKRTTAAAPGKGINICGGY
jgi:Transposase IS116/IS110/IS902 family